MEYSPAEGCLVCPYCKTEKLVDKVPIGEGWDFKTFDEKGEVPEAGASVYICPNCKAETVVTGFRTAEQCPFCGSTNVISAENLQGKKPDCILPFIVTKDQAVAGSKRWIKNKWFAPSKFKKSFKPEAMRPVYEPAYAFTSDTESAYDGRLGENKTRTVGSGENRRTETYIRWYYVKGTYVKRFEDMVIEASVHLDQRQMDKIGPFDTANALEYRKEFLAGYVAERPCDSVQKCFETAKSKMDAEIKRGILNKYSADHVDYLNIYTNHKTIFFKAILYPIYHSFFAYRGKKYEFFVNGRSGRASGKTPVSPWKVGIAVLVALAVLAGILYLMGFFE